jgi:hypothetical protein
VNRTGALWWVVVAVVVVVAGFFVGRGATAGPPLDPRSTEPLGTRALVEVLEHFGTEVRRGLPAVDTDRVLVLRDRLDDDRRSQLESWVGAGGVLVVADPSSPFGRSADAVAPSGVAEAGRCDVAAVAGLQRIEAATVLLLGVGPGESSCFGDGQEAWLVVRAEGEGSVVLVGGASAFVNENLGQGSNAAVATALLAPVPGRVAVVFDPVAIDDGERTLTGLIPDRVWWALAQLGVAFALYVQWRARRFGRPVPEAQPVELPGSLLVRARGDLYRRSRSHRRAARDLQHHAGRRLRAGLGIPDDGPLPVGEVAARLGVEPERVTRLLVAPPAADRADDLTALTDELDDLLARLAVTASSPGATTRDPSPATTTTGGA